MELRKLGISEIKVSSVGLGTMTFGEQCSKNLSFEILDFAFENGINFFDTAEMYPVYPKEETSGDSERIIGEWIHYKKNRDRVVIASKIASNNPSGIGATKLSWIRKGGENLTLDKHNITNAVDLSLKRLKTDYIDLYQIHWPERSVGTFGKLDFEYDPLDTWTPIEEVLHTLNDIVKEGKIKYIGISNETPWGILNYLDIAKKKKLPRIMSIQNCYSLLNRVFDIANSEVCIREKCSLLAYSPLAGGRLSGKYVDGARPENARYTMWPGRFSRHLTPRGDIAVKKYVNLANELNITPVALANAFVLSRPYVASSIVGATDVNQLKETLKATEIKMKKDIISKINDIHLSDPNPCV